MAGIFVSHTHGDKPIADAFARLIQTLFGERLTVAYSSKKEVKGGIQPGEEWFRWIVDQVRGTEVALILLTPSSIQKPWILWEAGAVAGAAYAMAADKARVFPVRVGIQPSEVPTPFGNIQSVNATDEGEVFKLVVNLRDRFKEGATSEDWERFGEHRNTAPREFVEEVSEALLKLPGAITEGAIQEWLIRLDQFRQSERFSETTVIENWLDVAFGREDTDKLKPVDVRIHRRLGDIYAAGGKKQAADAARQFRLARQLSPRDIYILRRLGKAYLDQDNRPLTKEIIDEIETLDPKAFETNAENAALKARWCEAGGNLAGARDVLEVAYAKMPESYYLGDRLGQTLVKLGENARAKTIFGQVVLTVKSLHEQNVWTQATLLTAAVVRNDAAAEEESLGNLRRLRPSREELDSIERGLQGIVDALGGHSDVMERLHAI